MLHRNCNFSDPRIFRIEIIHRLQGKKVIYKAVMVHIPACVAKVLSLSWKDNLMNGGDSNAQGQLSTLVMPMGGHQKTVAPQDPTVLYHHRKHIAIIWERCPYDI